MKGGQHLLAALLCSGAATGLAQAGHAQAVAPRPPLPSADNAVVDAGSSIEDIIVTAQKRSERLRDVPISITPASGDQLKAQGITSPEDLGRVVPGFTVAKTTYGTPVFFIRGVGFNDTTLGVSPTVSVYMDQLPIAYSAMARGTTLDLERVEVLKGPQGTLFGQNSTGGLVNYIAAKPTDQLEAGFDLTFARFKEVNAEAYVSGPLSDTISARIAVRNEYRDDWQKGYTTNQSIGSKHFRNARLIVDFKPSSRVKIELLATGWEDKSDSQQVQFVAFDPLRPGPAGYPIPFPIGTFPAAPSNNRAAAWDPGRDFGMDKSFYQFGARADVEIADNFDLTSLTSYSHYRQSVATDFDGTVFPLSVNTDNGRIRSFSQELRLSGTTADGRVKGMAGINYQDDSVFENLVADPITNTASRFGPFLLRSTSNINSQDVSTTAVFGSLDVSLTDTLTLQGSARYTWHDRDFEGCSYDTGDGSAAGVFGFLSTIATGVPRTIAPGACITLDTTGAPVTNIVSKLKEHNLSWRGSLNWKPTSDMLVYANVTKGYKSGSFPTLPFVVTTQANAIKQESVLGYEAGLKLGAFSNRLQINGAMFYYDYKDKQLRGFILAPPLGVFATLVTIPKSTVKGAELSVTMRPVGGLTISASGTYVDTRIDRNPTLPIGSYGNVANFVGQPFSNAPKWQGILDAEYRFPVGTDLSAYLGTTISARSSTAGALRSGDPAVAAREDLLTLRGYTLVDLRAGVEVDGGAWRAEIFGRNITNKFYLIGSGKFSDYVIRYTGTPATYGASLYFRY
ncbi:TonB-dependent receptor [Sphingomonas sp. SRS2]|uniref:TonB-dependent receptor n=1 Tax=Sphingomonas sp. SRS2 TaxID=133190 RepID=UPI00061846F4|nr:TonB-dependent receptor [Sphingomonas sp. SRS2]KKC26639.1 TonB-dependent receptor [Sphingomonas sp. SRS2]